MTLSYQYRNFKRSFPKLQEEFPLKLKKEYNRSSRFTSNYQKNYALARARLKKMIIERRICAILISKENYPIFILCVFRIQTTLQYISIHIYFFFDILIILGKLLQKRRMEHIFQEMKLKLSSKNMQKVFKNQNERNFFSLLNHC